MNSLHLFSGIGGGILADKILGNNIVGAVEIERYCVEVLKQHQKEGLLEQFPIFNDVRTFKGTEIERKINLVCGGFPCQDISTVGSGVGITGRKSGLFMELVRICDSIKPEYIFLENSPAICARGLDKVLYEIAVLGYNAEWSTLSAFECGALHHRNRWWCLCKRNDIERDSELLPKKILSKLNERFKVLGAEIVGYKDSTFNPDEIQIKRAGVEEGTKKETDNNSKEDVVEGDCSNGEMLGFNSVCNGEEYSKEIEEGVNKFNRISISDERTGLWEIEPDVGRMAHGVSKRVDRIKSLGNAQVPIAAALAFYLLMRRFAYN